MAAIIARLSAANWARKQRNRDKRKIPPEKSNRILPPFDQCYDPEKVDGRFSHKGSQARAPYSSCKVLVRQLSGSRQAVVGKGYQIQSISFLIIRAMQNCAPVIIQKHP